MPKPADKGNVDKLNKTLQKCADLIAKKQAEIASGTQTEEENAEDLQTIADMEAKMERWRAKYGTTTTP